MLAAGTVQPVTLLASTFFTFLLDEELHQSFAEIKPRNNKRHYSTPAGRSMQARKYMCAQTRAHYCK